MNISYRQAVPADSTDVVELVNAVYRGSAERQWTSEVHLIEGPRIDAKMFEEMISRNGSVVLVASDAESGRLVGCVHLVKADDTCSLGMLSVKASHQQWGIGRALLKYAEDYAAATFASTAVLMHVITARTELVSWYERRGYRRTGNLVPFGGEAASRSRPLQGPVFFETLRKDLG